MANTDADTIRPPKQQAGDASPVVMTMYFPTTLSAWRTAFKLALRHVIATGNTTPIGIIAFLAAETERCSVLNHSHHHALWRSMMTLVLADSHPPRGPSAHERARCACVLYECISSDLSEHSLLTRALFAVCHLDAVVPMRVWYPNTTACISAASKKSPEEYAAWLATEGPVSSRRFASQDTDLTETPRAAKRTGGPDADDEPTPVAKRARSLDALASDVAATAAAAAAAAPAPAPPK